jgi:hypothetical protein
MKACDFDLQVMDDQTTVTVSVGELTYCSLDGTLRSTVLPGSYATSGTTNGIGMCGQKVTVVFQQGISPTASYAGTADTTISEGKSNKDFGSYGKLYSDGSDPNRSGLGKKALIKWQLAGIPKHAKVERASLRFDVKDRGGTYEVFAMRNAWSVDSANWLKAKRNKIWGKPGMKARVDYLSASICTISHSPAGENAFSLNREGVRIVESWISGRRANHGIAICPGPYAEGGDNGFDISSSESEFPPALEITYSIPSQLF